MALLLAIVTGRPFRIESIVDGRATRNSAARSSLLDGAGSCWLATGCLFWLVFVAGQEILGGDGCHTLANLGGRCSLGVESIKDGGSAGRCSRSRWHGGDSKEDEKMKKLGLLGECDVLEVCCRSGCC